MRRVVIVLAALALAAGGGAMAFALPASAAPTTQFSAEVTNLPVLDDASDIHIDGSKPATSTITGVHLQSSGFVLDVSDDCQEGDSGPSTFNCDIDPGELEVFEDGQSSVGFDVTAADGTQTQNVVSFDVVADDGSQQSPGIIPDGATDYALRTYQFVPGGVVVTATPSPNETRVGFELEAPGEGWYGVVGCPTDVPYYDAWDEIPVGQNKCTFNYDDYSGDSGTFNGYFQVRSIEASGSTEPLEAENSAEDGFTVFEAPVETTVVPNTDHSVTVSGTDSLDIWGESSGGNADVWVYDGNSKVVCKTVNVSANWTCRTGPLGVGSHTLRAVTVDRGAGASEEFSGHTYYMEGALSDFSNSHVVTFAPAATPTPAASATTTDDNWSFTIDGIDPNNAQPGETFTVNGTGAPADVNFDVVLHSDPIDLGSTTSAADGTFSLTATIPLDAPPGDHHIEVTASGTDITSVTKSLPITLVPAAAPTGTSTTAPKPAKAVGTSAESEHGAQAKLEPNILTKALTPIKDVVAHPTKIVSAFEIGLVLLLLAVLPAHLLNATLSEQSERFERRFGKRKTPRWLAVISGWFRRAPVVGGILVTLATAILFGFADPAFGPTLASLRLVLAAAIALFFVGYLANALTGIIARAAWQIEVEVRTRPWGLILTIVAVIVSRLLHFAPGFLIGLVLGLAIEGRSAAGYAWRVVVVRTSIVLAMGILAWIGYSTLTLGGEEGGTFWSALLVETLVAITTEGIVALLVELLPLRTLEGERVYSHSKLLWGFLYVITLVVFVLAVVPWEGNWDALGGALWVWIAVLGVFAALCVGVYIYFRRFAPPLDEGEEEEVPLGESVGSER